MNKLLIFAIAILIVVFLLFLPIIILSGKNSSNQNSQESLPSRESKIPAAAVKITPQTDVNPVKSLSSEYSDPVPVPGKVNTAGAEDSAFIMPDGNTLYFFFTPDTKIPVEKQIIDEVTGIYSSKKANGSWDSLIFMILFFTKSLISCLVIASFISESLSGLNQILSIPTPSSLAASTFFL